MPDHLEASIEGLEAGSQVTAGDVELPAGVELAVDPELTVASITAAPTAEQLEATLPEVEVATDEAEAEVGETTEGSEGADAAAEGAETTEARTEA